MWMCGEAAKRCFFICFSFEEKTTHKKVFYNIECISWRIGLQKGCLFHSLYFAVFPQSVKTCSQQNLKFVVAVLSHCLARVVSGLSVFKGGYGGKKTKRNRRRKNATHKRK